MNAIPGQRLLRPVAETFRPDGAPFVRLSPTKGMKNASILYEAIKSLPDGTLLRGDFDRRAKPLVYFPEKPPKKVEIKSPIKAKNIEAGRKELANFLSSIVEAAYMSADPATKLIKASVDLKLKMDAIDRNGGDFNVGDIRQSLHTIANAYMLENVRKLTSPHRLVPQQGSQIQGKRFREFVTMDRAKFDQLAKALEDPNASKYDTTPMIAVFEMKELLKAFLAQPSDRKKSFAQFLRLKGITRHQQFFAKRWRQISGAHPTQERKDLVTEPWSFELDKVCALIDAETKRHCRIDGGADRPVHDYSRKPSQLMPDLPSALPVPGGQTFEIEKPAEAPARQLSPSAQGFSPEQPETPEDGREPERALPTASELPKLVLPLPDDANLQENAAPGALALLPKQVWQPPLPLSASARALADAELPKKSRVPASALLQPNPLYTRADINLFEADGSDEMNQLHPADSGSQSDLLRYAFVPRSLVPFARGKRVAPPSLPIANLEGIPYSPLPLQPESPEVISGAEMLSSQLQESVTQDSTVSGADQHLPEAAVAARPQPSLMMVYPKQGYSPLDISTTEEDQ